MQFPAMLGGFVDAPTKLILVGETPDPRRIPGGCRFHPRCPLVASGEAARLGIEDRCRGVDVTIDEQPGESVAAHRAACHAV